MCPVAIFYPLMKCFFILFTHLADEHFINWNGMRIIRIDAIV